MPELPHRAVQCTVSGQFHEGAVSGIRRAGGRIFSAGNHAPVVRMLEEKMNQASEEMEFEKAIEYRDLIRSIHQVSAAPEDHE